MRDAGSRRSATIKREVRKVREACAATSSVGRPLCRPSWIRGSFYWWLPPSARPYGSRRGARPTAQVVERARTASAPAPTAFCPRTVPERSLAPTMCAYRPLPRSWFARVCLRRADACVFLSRLLAVHLARRVHPRRVLLRPGLCGSRLFYRTLHQRLLRPWRVRKHAVQLRCGVDGSRLLPAHLPQRLRAPRPLLQWHLLLRPGLLR